MKLEEYIEIFKENNITGSILLKLNESDFENSLKVEKLGHRK
jgi:hypothetical protein